MNNLKEIDKLLKFNKFGRNEFNEHQGWEHTLHKYNYRHLLNNMCYWLKPRYCVVCGELTLKHNKPILKERDKWIAIEHGVVRTQSAYNTDKTRLDKYYKEGSIDTGEELDNLFCNEFGYTDKDFSKFLNGCERREWSDGSTISFRYKHHMLNFLHPYKNFKKEKTENVLPPEKSIIRFT